MATHVCTVLVFAVTLMTCGGVGESKTQSWCDVSGLALLQIPRRPDCNHSNSLLCALSQAATQRPLAQGAGCLR